ncbi:MAG: hypothetical protein WC943_03385 [Elusimicrobiota bacterium]
MQTRQAAEELKKPDLQPERRQELLADNVKSDAKVEQGLVRFPKSQGLQTAGAEYFLSRGDLDKANSSAERAIGLAKPGGDRAMAVKAWTIKGLADFQKRDFLAAYNAGKTALKGNPDYRPAIELTMYSESALHLRGMDALVAERTKRIMALTDRTVTHTPKEWAAQQVERPTESGRLSRKAMEARRKGDLAAQGAFAEAAVQADPSDPMAYFQRGRARSEAGDYNGAITDLTQAMVQGWTEPALFKLRAEALLLAGSYLAAQQDAMLAIAYEPKMAAAYALRAQAALMLHLDRRDLDSHAPEVMADLEKALALEPALADNPTFKALFEQAQASIAEIRAGPPSKPGSAPAGAVEDTSAGSRGASAVSSQVPAPGSSWQDRLTMKTALAIGGTAFVLLALAGVLLGLKDRQSGSGR